MSTDPAHVLASMTPISLDELNARASLLTRVDRKYLVPLPLADALLAALTPHAAVLDIGGIRSFSYSSTYFDTPGLDSFMASAHPRRRRFKVRTRSYLDSAQAFLEVKTRGSRGSTVKDRVPIDPDDAARLTRSGREMVADRLVAHEVASAHRARRLAFSLTPVLRSRYERSTLVIVDDAARLTLDASLRWTRLGRDGSRGACRETAGLVIVESKSTSTPSMADRWLWRAGVRPTRVSKYATGLAVLEPTLPANRWHRVMHGALAKIPSRD